MIVAEKQARLVEDLGLIEDPQERLAAVVDRARRRPPLPEADRTEANRIRGCQSQVWVAATLVEGRLRLRFEADSPLVKGLVALLVDLYDGASPDDIAATEPTIMQELGLDRTLSPTRKNGLAAVRTHIKAVAQAFAA